MNRSFPPYPPSPPPFRGGPSGYDPRPPPRRRMMHQMREGNALVPVSTLMKLIAASERQSQMWREIALMTERRYGQLHMEAQDIVISLSQESPEWAAQIKENHDATIEGASMLKTVVEYLVQLDLYQQNNMKRWLHRMPPIRALPQPPVFMQGPPPAYAGYPQQYPGEAQQPPQGYPQQGQQQAQQALPQQPPQAPLGDYRDPAVLAEAMKRAQPMPVGPQPVYTQQTGAPSQVPVQQTNVQPIPVQQTQAPQQTTQAPTPSNGAGSS